jgi:hypothetical protein
MPGGFLGGVAASAAFALSSAIALIIYAYGGTNCCGAAIVG